MSSSGCGLTGCLMLSLNKTRLKDDEGYFVALQDYEVKLSIDDATPENFAQETTFAAGNAINSEMNVEVCPTDVYLHFLVSPVASENKRSSIYDEAVKTMRYSFALETLKEEFKESDTTETSFVLDWGNLKVQTKMEFVPPVRLSPDTPYKMDMQLGGYPPGAEVQFVSLLGPERSLKLPFKDIQYDGFNELFVEYKVDDEVKCTKVCLWKLFAKKKMRWQGDRIAMKLTSDEGFTAKIKFYSD